MTELGRDRAEDAKDSPVEPDSPLRRALWWVVAFVLLFAVIEAVGIFFAITMYRTARHEHAEWATRARRWAQAILAERALMIIAFLVLARALVKYRDALKQPTEEKPIDELTAKETNCWRTLAWVAALYTGWQLTLAFVY